MKRLFGQFSTARGLSELAVLVVAVLAAWILWPSSLGGSTRFIIVAGQSMEPTYQSGDLVMLNTDADIAIGDIVVFQIPDGQVGAGQLVIHRLIGENPDGTLITQGDNRDSPDSFPITRSDVMGTPRFSVPFFGRVVGFLKTPMAIGAATGLLFTMMLWPRRPVSPPPLLVGLSIDDEGWSSLTIPPQAESEAEAWLHAQLSREAA